MLIINFHRGQFGCDPSKGLESSDNVWFNAYWSCNRQTVQVWYYFSVVSVSNLVLQLMYTNLCSKNLFNYHVMVVWFAFLTYPINVLQDRWLLIKCVEPIWSYNRMVDRQMHPIHCPLVIAHLPTWRATIMTLQALSVKWWAGMPTALIKVHCL